MTSPAQWGKIETAERDEVQENSTPKRKKKGDQQEINQAEGHSSTICELKQKILDIRGENMLCYEQRRGER